MFKKMIVDYSIVAAPFAFYRKHKSHDKAIVEKSESLSQNHFFRVDGNTIRFDSFDQFGAAYHRYVYIKPFFCNCKTFWDKSYCHHILAVNRLGIANIILDPNFVPEPEKRRLLVRIMKRVRTIKVDDQKRWEKL